MKRIRALDGPPPGLADDLEGDGDKASWNGFRSHQGGDAKRELMEALCSIQHGLCGYCEINIVENDRQVEHVIPQSNPEQGRDRALDPKNTMLCCQGGTTIIRQDDERRLQPPRPRLNRSWNISCGEAKGNRVDPGLIDPRDLPTLPSLMKVRFDGKIRADAEACAKASIDVDRVRKTIEILGLNVERLRRAREKRWDALSENLKRHFDDFQIIKEAARGGLLPGEDGCLPKFFSTNRSYFKPMDIRIEGCATRASTNALGVASL